MIGLDEKATREQGSGQRRWTLGRLSTDLAIVMVAVPILINSIAPQERLRNFPRCGNTTENHALALGLMILSVRFVWKILFDLNDGILRALDSHVPDHDPEA